MRGREWVACWITVALISAGAAVILVQGSAKASTVGNKDCWAALEDRSLVKPCRRLGWTITHHLVISRHKAVRAYDLDPCTFEDGSGGPLPCGWNIGAMPTGDREGRAFWVSPTRHLHYVWGRQPTVILTGWAHWARPGERDRLDIGKACWVRRIARHRWRHECP
jgi:hypothetical protein